MKTIFSTKAVPTPVNQTVYAILFAISFSHLLNDLIQSIIPSVYPMFKENFSLTFSQVGLITMTSQLSASVLQPFVGLYTDKHPNSKSLAIAMSITLIGLICISLAPTFPILLASVALIGVGSAIFHPEASRVAHLASGGKKGLAQSVFQVGGNAGTSIGPLLAALIIIPYGQQYIGWFGVVALLGIVLLSLIGRWYGANLANNTVLISKTAQNKESSLSRSKILISMLILMLLIFSKYIYMASMTNYFTFYLIDKFGISIQQSQLYLFAFLGAIAAGTIIGGPLGDRYGRKLIIWISILGAAPFTLLLPHMDLVGTVVLAIIIGIIISSAFSAILVYATELVPGKVGMISGMFFGFAFGIAGIGSAILGELADHTSIAHVFSLCAYLPLIGIITAFLPNIEPKRKMINAQNNEKV
ncbi:MFS transporter [Parapedobacter sp. SGR-10]|uniref:MFS transporter n=1 Tax=Parapedobacter sp. SGR-10 TaxID=2710879 RepID=UPI0013D134FC|nr:MFS transporter [Parapedobacter sp. SGR-10]NGF56111.1 MFS transporter [Parapedobacter sp. SGR-10]